MTSTPSKALPPCDPLRALLDELLDLKARILSGTEEELRGVEMERTSPDRCYSIRNLLNYIVMRREDLRPLQTRLSMAGLSSLGRGEPHVLSNIDSVIDMLSWAISAPPSAPGGSAKSADYEAGYRQLRQRAERLFGVEREGRSVYIMITLPTEAADDPQLVEGFVAAGMDVARINCAHDDETAWSAMVDNVRRAAEGQQRACRILMDLGGHKIRTCKVIAGGNSGKIKKNPPRVHLGDWLVLCKKKGDPARYGTLFEVPVKALVTCSRPDIVDRLQRDQAVWIDDGKVGAIVEACRDDAVLLRVNLVGPKGVRIKEEKGLNFPETRLNLPTLSRKDTEDLPFVARHADMVGLSFTEGAEDILLLQEQLRLRQRDDLPIVAKIETAHGVQNLPEIITGSMARNIDLGIMIARGDLAIELGSVRMAEIQEEVLWLCEAAHVPVVWATQVFESLAKKGVASRPEITDAAMSVRAECVMLNKGPYIRQVTHILSDVLQRMEAHQFKKISRLRALHW